MKNTAIAALMLLVAAGTSAIAQYSDHGTRDTQQTGRSQTDSQGRGSYQNRQNSIAGQVNQAQNDAQNRNAQTPTDRTRMSNQNGQRYDNRSGDQGRSINQADRRSGYGSNNNAYQGDHSQPRGGRDYRHSVHQTCAWRNGRRSCHQAYR